MELWFCLNHMASPMANIYLQAYLNRSANKRHNLRT